MRKAFFILLTSVFFNTVFVFADTNLEDKPSFWAETDINESISLGLIPTDMQNSYTKNISREEFCRLIINFIEVSGTNIDSIEGLNWNNIIYKDTASEYVKKAAALKIVNGYENNFFYPENYITRQEAAQMLYMTEVSGQRFKEIKKSFSEAFNTKVSETILPHLFEDGENINSWAHKAIYFNYKNGIMLGEKNNHFNPNGNYTREQAYLTILRLFKLTKNEEINIVSNNELYVKSNGEFYGYMNSMGLWEIEPVFKHAYDFYGDYALTVSAENYYQVIDKNGNVILKGFTHGIKIGNIVSLENTEGSYSIKNNEIIGEHIFADDFVIYSFTVNNELVPIKDIYSKLYGYYNIDGDIKINNIYNEAYFFRDGNAVVFSEGNYKLIDTEGKVIKDKINVDTNKYDIIICYGDSIFIKDKNTGKDMLYKAEKETISPFEGNLKDIFKSGKFSSYDDYNNISFYDENGNLIEKNLSEVNEFGDGVYRYTYNEQYSNKNGGCILNKYGIIFNIWDRGQNSISCIYLGNGLYLFYGKDNNLKITDIHGNVITKFGKMTDIRNIKSNNGLIEIYNENEAIKYYTLLGEKVMNG